MIRLQLDEEERAILLQLLESCISDMKGEITATENYDYKTMLKGRKAVLLKLYEALQETVSVSSMT
jgi:hypothetical protein